MLDCDHYVTDAARDAGVRIRILEPAEARAHREAIRQRFAWSPHAEVLWHGLGERVSVQHEHGWRAIPLVAGAGPCFVFLDESRSRQTYVFDDAHDVERMLREAVGFEYYVSDQECTYLVAFNDHDFLIACGDAAPRLSALLPDFSRVVSQRWRSAALDGHHHIPEDFEGRPTMGESVSLRNRAELSFDAFASADHDTLVAKVRDLADLVTASVREQVRFGEAVFDVVIALRELGHTMYSLDADDDFERWTNFGPKSSGDGLTIEFQRRGASQVSWRFNGQVV